MYGTGLYGQNYYSSNIDGTGADESFINLMELLPDYYQGVREAEELQTILGYKVGDVKQKTQGLLDQCFISTATQGLDRWEKIFGIQTDMSKSYERRREILLAKLRGTGTTTKEMVKNVSIAFSGGEVAIQEYPAEYRFVVQFIGIKGVPQNMAGLIAALDEIKPAHLAYSFKYTYTVWQQINMTWQQAEQKTWGDLKIFEGE
jgi:uncharacterized protein YmfQ (DUF2313 family)